MSAKVRRGAATLWQRRALRVGARIPREALHPRVMEWCSGGPARRGGWGVACSGGPDSLALLLLLWAHWPERRRSLVLLHFDHRLRGAASRADARFCREVSRGLRIRFAAGAWRRPPKAASEAAAREARMAFLTAACRRRRLGALWFGHQEDDIAESLLMRLARGSGTGGLCAPRPVAAFAGGPTRLRPLLTLRKAEIVSALRVERVPWREDRTNRSPEYFRNRVRDEVVVPWAAAAGRDAVAGAAWSRELLEEDDEALERWTTQRDALTDAGRLRLARLADCPAAVWRRALHRWLRVQPHGVGMLSRAGFSGLLAAVRSGRKVRLSLGRNAFAVVRGGYLRMVWER